MKLFINAKSVTIFILLFSYLFISLTNFSQPSVSALSAESIPEKMITRTRPLLLLQPEIPSLKQEKTSSSHIPVNFLKSSSKFILENNALPLDQLLAGYQEKLEEYPYQDLSLNLFFEQRLGVELTENVKTGIFLIRENRIAAEQDLVNYYLDNQQNSLSNRVYDLKGMTASQDLFGIYFAREFLPADNFSLSLRFKNIFLGHFDKSVYAGRVRVDQSVFYPSGYRKKIVSRDSNNQVRGISLDVDISASPVEDFTIQLTALNFLDFIIWRGLYFREMYDRRGYFNYQNQRRRITPEYNFDLDYHFFSAGFNYLYQFRPYIGFGSDLPAVSFPGRSINLTDYNLRFVYYPSALAVNRQEHPVFQNVLRANGLNPTISPKDLYEIRLTGENINLKLKTSHPVLTRSTQFSLDFSFSYDF